MHCEFEEKLKCWSVSWHACTCTYIVEELRVSQPEWQPLSLKVQWAVSGNTFFFKMKHCLIDPCLWGGTSMKLVLRGSFYPALVNSWDQVFFDQKKSVKQFLIYKFNVSPDSAQRALYDKDSGQWVCLDKVYAPENRAIPTPILTEYLFFSKLSEEFTYLWFIQPLYWWRFYQTFYKNPFDFTIVMIGSPAFTRCKGAH